MDEESEVLSDSSYSDSSSQINTENAIKTTTLQRPTLRIRRTVSNDSDLSEVNSDLASPSPLLRLVQKYQRLHYSEPQDTRRSPRINRKLPSTIITNIASHHFSPEAKFLSTCAIAEDEEESEILDIKIFGLHVYELDDDLKEPVSLHEVVLYDKPHEPLFCFDGTLMKSNGTSQYITGARITRVSVDNLRDTYDSDKPRTSTAPIWLESKTSAKYRAWYLIESASSTYESHFAPFVWLTKFTKYIISYLIWATTQGQKIHLLDLKHNFLAKLIEWYEQDVEFQQWHDSCRRIQDFQSVLTCSNYAPFISGQAWDISNDDNDDELRVHPIWDEAGLPQERPANEKSCSERTSVTKHIAECFLQSFPTWGPGPQGWNLLKVVKFDPEVQQWRQARLKALGLRDSLDSSSTLDVHTVLDQAKNTFSELRKPMPGSTLVGKVVLVHLHNAKCYSRPCTCEDLRFAYTHNVDVYTESEIEVSWLLTPSKTACYGSHAGRDVRKKAKSFYPTTNELFLDGEANVYTVATSDVLRSFLVSLGTNSACDGDDVFIARAYYHKDRSFRVLDDTILKQYVTLAPEIKLDPKEIKIFSLFTGSGLFDFGLECGSGNRMKRVFAADINGEALKSAQANHSHAISCEYNCDDVNGLLQEFCVNHRKPFDTDCIVAGCPCPGYSRINPNKQSVNGQRQCSMLANTLAWVELLLPKMVVIENVPDMDSHAVDYAKPTAAGQAISCLGSLGYQAKIVQIRASDFGGATNRERIFILATIPAIRLPNLSQLTQDVNTTESVTRDLYYIKNDTALNVLHPDHTPFERLDPIFEEFVTLIPKDIPVKLKRMSTILSAVPSMNKEQKQIYQEYCNTRTTEFQQTLRRVHPHRPFGTITTKWSLLDPRGYPKIHWSQNRTVSLLELRRFHGVPDDYILVGSKLSQLAQIGNSVAFAASFTIGKMLAESWQKACSQRQRSVTAALTMNRGHNTTKQISAVTGDRKNQIELKRTRSLTITEDEGDTIVVDVKRSRLSVEKPSTAVITSLRSQSTIRTNEHPTRVRFDPSSGQPLVVIPFTNQQKSRDDQANRGGNSTNERPISVAGSTFDTAIVIYDD